MCYIGIPTRMVFTSAHVRGGLSALAIVLAAAEVTAQASQRPQGQALQVVPVVRGDHLYVSTELRDGLSADVRAAIDSGLKTIFTFTIDLRLDAPGWFNRTIATSVVTNSVEYDNLRRMYTLERRIDGRNVKPETTEDPVRVREWMTSLKDLQLFSTRVLQPNREYYVRVNATARPSYGSILWPFGSGTSAQTKFVFFR
jgi:hypothetical protein